MVERCTRRLTVIDLDGTLFNGSTLKRLYLFALTTALKRADIKTVMTVLSQSVLEIAGIKTHRESKHSIMKRLETVMTENDFAIFASSLTSRLNTEVVDTINSRREAGDYLLLSSASPSVYCRQLARMLSFDSCHSTETTEQIADYTENRSDEKTRRLSLLIKNQNLSLDCVMTDHHDDAPLFKMNRNGRNILVNPSEETITVLKKLKLDFEVIRHHT